MKLIEKKLVHPGPAFFKAFKESLAEKIKQEITNADPAEVVITMSRRDIVENYMRGEVSDEHAKDYDLFDITLVKFRTPFRIVEDKIVPRGDLIIEYYAT